MKNKDETIKYLLNVATNAPEAPDFVIEYTDESGVICYCDKHGEPLKEAPSDMAIIRGISKVIALSMCENMRDNLIIKDSEGKIKAGEHLLNSPSMKFNDNLYLAI